MAQKPTLENPGQSLTIASIAAIRPPGADKITKDPINSETVCQDKRNRRRPLFLTWLQISERRLLYSAAL